MKLDAVEFIRRFLLHVLPAGFVKIRHFGLLANRNRRQALALCQASSSRSRLADPSITADRTTEVCAQPIVPTVQMRHLHVVARCSVAETPNPGLTTHCVTFDSS